MNREQLEEIRKRAEKATKGPWRVVIDDSESATTVARECDSDAHPLVEDPGRDYIYDDCLDGELHSEPFFREADAEFIAHARTDVPALLDEIERLQKRLHLVNRAKAHLFARIIASSHLLEKPFTNAPDQSPWTKVSFAMSALTEALTTAEGSAEGGTPNGSKEGS